MSNLIQGNIIPSTTTDICNSQYILNWIATGGDQGSSDQSGNTTVYSTFLNDTSYNIPDNRISFNFDDPSFNNISIRDAQYLINWNAALPNNRLLNRILGQDIDNSYSVHEYSYPESRDYISLVTYEDTSFVSNDLSNIVINRLYLKQKNSAVRKDFTDISALPLDQHILANRIPYLKFIKNMRGSIIKRSDIVNNNGSSLQIYSTAYDFHRDICQNIIVTISNENLSRIDISRNTNNIFPPVQDFDNQGYITKGFFPDFVTVSNFPDSEKINDISNQLILQPWFSSTDSSYIATRYALNNPTKLNLVYVYHKVNDSNWKAIYNTGTGTGILGDSNNYTWVSSNTHSNWAAFFGGHGTVDGMREYAKALLSPKIVNIYSYLNVGDTRPYKNNVNYTTTYTNVNNQQIEIPNWGVQSIDLSRNILDNRLTAVNSLNTTTNNMLNINSLNENNILDFNTTSWFLANQPVNTTQGHFVGQFAFTNNSEGSMIYQYYYSTENDESIYTDNSPYTIYLNISGGRLEFPGKFPDENTYIRNTSDFLGDIGNGTSTDKHQVPWYGDPNGILAKIVANIYKQRGLRFCYNSDSTITGSTITFTKLYYKEWNDFKVIDASCAETAPGKWATFPKPTPHKVDTATTTASLSSDHKRLIHRANNTFLFEQPPDLSGSIYISPRNEDNNMGWYTYYRKLPSGSYLRGPEDIDTVSTLILGSENAYFIDDSSIDPLDSPPAPISGTTNIEHMAFRNYRLLKNIIFGNNLQEINGQIFYGLHNLAQVTIPASVISIDAMAFADCSGLRTITFLGNQPTNFTDLSFIGSPNLNTIFYINGTSGWSNIFLPGTIYVTPLPYNGNILQQQYNLDASIPAIRGESTRTINVEDPGKRVQIEIGSIVSGKIVGDNYDDYGIPYMTDLTRIQIIYNNGEIDEIQFSGVDGLMLYAKNRPTYKAGNVANSIIASNSNNETCWLITQKYIKFIGMNPRSVSPILAGAAAYNVSNSGTLPGPVFGWNDAEHTDPNQDFSTQFTEYFEKDTTTQISATTLSPFKHSYTVERIDTPNIYPRGAGNIINSWRFITNDVGINKIHFAVLNNGAYGQNILEDITVTNYIP